MDFRTQVYDSYGAFKSWDFGKYEANGETYEIEFARMGIKAPLKILEIGFGSGGFLSWAKSNGHAVVGTEVNPHFVDEAKKRGFEIYLSSNLDPLIEKSTKFDLVVAFDVLEHLYPEEIRQMLCEVKQVLNPNGRFFARFPNSISPFCGQVLHGDITHVTTTSVEKIMQLAAPFDYKLLMQANAARPVFYGRRPRWQRKLLFTFRDLIELILGNIYYGRRIPLDPNLSVVLE